MKTTKLEAQPRLQTGTVDVGRLRRQGWFPAVVYGCGKANMNVQLNEHDFIQLMKGHTSEHLIMDLEIAGDTPRKVLIKDVQHHPVSGRVIHVDFHEVSMTQKIRVEIPLALVGEPAGVSQQGGILEYLIRAVQVECLPADILEKIDLDVSGLHIGESLMVSHIKLDPAKYAVLSAPELALATVAAPRAEEVVAPVVVEGEAATGPEVITEKKAEEGEEGAGEAKKGGKEGGKEEAKKPAAKEEAKDEGKKPKEKK